LDRKQPSGGAFPEIQPSHTPQEGGFLKKAVIFADGVNVTVTGEVHA